jgi:two-component system, CAI-1 autoinducer sensor kinase/phosphatase CqsS
MQTRRTSRRPSAPEVTGQAFRRAAGDIAATLRLTLTAMRLGLARASRRLGQAALDATDFAEPRMVVFGLVATIGFPAYFFVWAYLFPQPYENLGLRVGCAIMAAPLLVVRYWPVWLRAFLPAYWYTILTLCLPLFFSFMLLQNEANLVWTASFAIAVMLVVTIMDAPGAILILVVGTALGVGLSLLSADHGVAWADVLPLLPIMAFALLAGVSFNLANAREQRARDRMARALGGHVAHELGNPLQTLGYGARQHARHVPDLIDTYRQARRAGLETAPIAENQLRGLHDVAGLMESEVEQALLVLDMMLKKADPSGSSEGEIRLFSVMSCAHAAVSRYLLTRPEEQDRIELDQRTDFTVVANEVLVSHVVLNLLANAIHAVKAARRCDAGMVRIWATSDRGGNRLHVLDNGVGIDAAARARLFQPFFTTRTGGTGLGLHFCRNIMQRLGGDITFRSRAGHATEFILRFPIVDEALPVQVPRSAGLQGGQVPAP